MHIESRSSPTESSHQPTTANASRRRPLLSFLCCCRADSSPRFPAGTQPPIGDQDRIGQMRPQGLYAAASSSHQPTTDDAGRRHGAADPSPRVPAGTQPAVGDQDRISTRLAKAKQLSEEVFDDFKAEVKNSSDNEIEINKQLDLLAVLKQRFDVQIEQLTTNLDDLYGHRHDFDDIFKSMTQKLITIGLSRPEELKELDKKRENDPSWFISNKSVETSIYVDSYCGKLSELEKDIELFKLLNINILHLMPTIYKGPAGDNDGGYAISDFRSLNPEIGTIEEMSELFAQLRKNGISPALDITPNHTSDEHQWAQEALAGNSEKQEYYFFMDEAEKEQYQPYLGDVFPTLRKGSFTWNNDLEKYVWTTFKSCQWDLNYSNPKVLMSMAEEMLFLANKGAEVLRLDAVPFLWKKKGTDCLNQDEIPSILRVFNGMAKITAPALIFKSEAIVDPEDAIKYLGPDKCQIAYNPLLMTMMWDALCSQSAQYMSRALANHIQTPEGSAWVNYVRCHDDLYYTFDQDSAQKLGIDLDERRRIMNEFYLGKTEGSFAKGKEFQPDPQTGMARVAGTLASLVGIEKALELNDPQQIDAAIKRISLINSVILSMPGIPLLNLIGGDDRGQINDYSYLKDDAKKDDDRWLNRLKRDTDFKQTDAAEISVMDQSFTALVNLTRIRVEEMPAFGSGQMQLIETGKDPVLGFIRQNDQQKVMVLANFSDKPQSIDAHYLLAHDMAGTGIDKIGPKENQQLQLSSGLELAPYQGVWLVPENKA